MERELTLEIVRVTEIAALESAPWIGRGDKINADEAAHQRCERCLTLFP